MYYYFLGKFLTGNSRLGIPVINEMCINSHREANYLTLLFAIHHTTDNSIIEDLLLRTAEKLKEVLRVLSFVWIMVNIEQVVEAFNIPEIREAIESAVDKNATPAYDLIGYFSRLDSATELTNRERDSLESLLKKHDDLFVQRVLSIRTQSYMNTHRSRAQIEQAVCSLLDIRYRPRLLPSS